MTIEQQARVEFDKKFGPHAPDDGLLFKGFLAAYKLLAEDAENYRWLRDHSMFCNDSMQEIWFDESYVQEVGEAEEFDAAIKAARTKGAEHG